jgi:hypothetical protein
MQQDSRRIAQQETKQLVQESSQYGSGDLGDSDPCRGRHLAHVYLRMEGEAEESQARGRGFMGNISTPVSLVGGE